jgi:hypothetical protein
VQIRWQRLSRELAAADGPTVEVMPVEEIPERLAFYEPCSADDYARRIAARQAGVATRMVG